MNLETTLSLPSLTLAVPLLQNLVLVLAFAFLYAMLHPSLQRLHALGDLLTGAMLGIFTILLPPVSVVPGVYIGGRTLIFVAAGAIRGWRSGLAAALVYLPYTVINGGIALPASLLATFSAAAFGAAIFHFRARQPYYSTRELLLLGLGAALCRLISFLLLPGDLPLATLRETTIPLLFFYPLCMYLVGMLLIREIRRADLEAAMRIRDLAFRISPNAVFIIDHTARITMANQAASGLVGESDNPDELKNLSLGDILTEESWNSIRAIIENETVVADVPVNRYPMAATARTYDGWVFPVTLSFAPLRNQQGSGDGFVVIMIDMSAQKRAEERIEQERALLRTVIDAIPDHVYVKDPYSHFVACNESVARSFGVASIAKVLGCTDFDFYEPELAQRFRQEDMAVMTSGQPLFNVEEPKRSPDGTLQGWILTTKVPLYDVRGNTLGLVGVGRDITDHKNAETQAMEAQLERQKVDLVRNFLSDASHDLRTPLTVMNTSLYLLGRTASADQKHHVETLEGQTARIHRLIEDMLTLSRLELAKMIFEMSPVDLNMIARDSAWEKRAVLDAKQHTLHLEVAPTPLKVFADSGELHRALGQLIDNAAVFTPPSGQIFVTTRCREHDAIIEVRDNGIGIPSDDLPHIFERFYRVDKARSADTGGSGLGLTIVHKIIEAHHGHIEVESTQGQGSTFRIVIPLVRSNKLSAGESNLITDL